MKIGDLYFGVFFLVFALFIFVYSVATFPVVHGARFGPDFFPSIVSVLMAMCGIVLVVRGLRNRNWEFSLGAWRGNRRSVAAGVIMIAGVFLYIFFLDSLGFIVLAVANTTILMVILGNRLLPSVILSTVVTATAFFVFTHLLYVPLPAGILGFL